MWYEIDESETATEDEASMEPIVSLDTFVRDSKQLRLFNIFTRQDYSVPFSRIYEELRFLGSDSPTICPQDVVEHTNVSAILTLLPSPHSKNHGVHGLGPRSQLRQSGNNWLLESYVMIHITSNVSVLETH